MESENQDLPQHYDPPGRKRLFGLGRFGKKAKSARTAAGASSLATTGGDLGFFSMLRGPDEGRTSSSTGGRASAAASRARRRGSRLADGIAKRTEVFSYSRREKEFYLLEERVDAQVEQPEEQWARKNQLLGIGNAVVRPPDRFSGLVLKRLRLTVVPRVDPPPPVGRDRDAPPAAVGQRALPDAAAVDQSLAVALRPVARPVAQADHHGLAFVRSRLARALEPARDPVGAGVRARPERPRAGAHAPGRAPGAGRLPRQLPVGAGRVALVRDLVS